MNQLDSNTLIIGGIPIKPGERKRIDLDVAALYDTTEMRIPVEVIRGTQPGPCMFITAALHGDEINGVEVIKRLRAKNKFFSRMKGTLILIPVVNVFGFNNKIRYLPDRRDLNRCFPGKAHGSLGSQVAHTLMNEIIKKCTHGIDLHTGAIHRANLPQIRGSIDDKTTRKLAEAFGVPVILNSTLRDGSLRQAGIENDVVMLLFEGGEALRYDEKVIRACLSGIRSVMSMIGMIETGRNPHKSRKNVFIARSSYWVRAPVSGSLHILKKMGAQVNANDVLGVISDPFGEQQKQVIAPRTGIIIGSIVMPLVNQGDALFHIACFDNVEAVGDRIEEFDDYNN